MLKQGDFLQPAAEVAAGTPERGHPLPPNAADPLDSWPRWLTSQRPDHGPVAVNRVWQAYFGTGLVSTSEDLGVQSEAVIPSCSIGWPASWWIAVGV